MSAKPCVRCDCPDCVSGYENHEHYCTHGKGCVETLGSPTVLSVKTAPRLTSEGTTFTAEVDRVKGTVSVRMERADGLGWNEWCIGSEQLSALLDTLEDAEDALC